MSDVPSKVRDQDGSTRKVRTISGNREHVGNLIYEGRLKEEDRLDAVILLYEGQIAAKQRDIVSQQGTSHEGYDQDDL